MQININVIKVSWSVENETALGDWKSDNNNPKNKHNNKNNVAGQWGPISWSKKGKTKK